MAAAAVLLLPPRLVSLPHHPSRFSPNPALLHSLDRRGLWHQRHPLRSSSAIGSLARRLLRSQVWYSKKSGLMDDGTKSILLGVWMVLCTVFAARKFQQPIKVDISDKSVFMFNALPYEEKNVSIQRSSRGKLNSRHGRQSQCTQQLMQRIWTYINTSMKMSTAIEMC